MFRLAAVGLDTSHSVAFTELIQGEKNIVGGLRVVSCLRFPSAFKDEAGQDAGEKKMESLGVGVTRSLDEALRGVDGVVLEINDPGLHLEYFTRIADRGLPVFIDKPLADSIESGKEIVRLARDKNVPVWSSSSLRFIPEIIACKGKVAHPLLCNVYGPLGSAARGSSLVWYGVHAFEMLSTLMGSGAREVFARRDPTGVVAIVQYPDNRRGIVECNSKTGKYGGRAQDAEKSEPFVAAGSPYPELIKALERFFLEGAVPVQIEDTLEIQAMMEAAGKSLESGEPEKIL